MRDLGILDFLPNPDRRVHRPFCPFPLAWSLLFDPIFLACSVSAFPPPSLFLHPGLLIQFPSSLPCLQIQTSPLLYPYSILWSSVFLPLFPIASCTFLLSIGYILQGQFLSSAHWSQTVSTLCCLDARRGTIESCSCNISLQSTCGAWQYTNYTNPGSWDKKLLSFQNPRRLTHSQIQIASSENTSPKLTRLNMWKLI